MIPHESIDFLPGRIELDSGKSRDYQALAPFHYLGPRPATWAGIVTATFVPDRRSSPPRVVGVAVLSYPSALHRARHRTFGLKPLRFGHRLRWVNANLRTISRVIVHPQFRAIGLARLLIEAICLQCPTRLIESSARMGRAHPMFETAGFTRVDPIADDEPVYYWRRLQH